jgi:hypothetical protein
MPNVPRGEKCPADAIGNGCRKGVRSRKQVVYADPTPPVIEDEELQPYPSSLVTSVERCPVVRPKNLILVGSTSRQNYREAVEQLGSYFCLELDFDHRPYCAWEYDPLSNYCTRPKTDDDLRAFLFIDPEESRQRHWQTFGAACFRFRRLKKNDNSLWVFAWIWLHPIRRGQNHMARVYPYFRAMFDAFAFQEPISRDMWAFLKKAEPGGYLGIK